MKMVLDLPNEQATAALGAAIMSSAAEGDVIALVGELGAGKTSLVRGMAEALGIDAAAVSSPTYVFVHEYEPADAAQPVLVHIDAYRIESERAFVATVWGEDGEDLREGAVVVVEWADRVAGALPEGGSGLRVTLTHVEGGRRAVLEGGARWETVGSGFKMSS